MRDRPSTGRDCLRCSRPIDMAILEWSEMAAYCSGCRKSNVTESLERQMIRAVEVGDDETAELIANALKRIPNDTP